MPRNSLNSSASTLPPPGPRLRVGKLCVAIQADSPAKMIERAEAALQDARFIELRLDSLAKPAAVLPKVKGE